MDPSRVLVLPFVDMTAVYGESTQVRCPVSGQVFMTGPVAAGAVGVLTDALTDALTRRRDLAVIPPGQGVGVMSKLLAGDSSGLSERGRWVEAARRLGADAVLVGHLYRFAERRGADYSVQQPASVAFDLHLLATNDRLLWSRAVDETQQALSENLLAVGTFLKRGGRWVTVNELAAGGLDRILASLPLGNRLDKDPMKD